MVHWRFRLPLIALIALSAAAVSGKLGPLGFFW
jgi:hypothetical protein